MSSPGILLQFLLRVYPVRVYNTDTVIESRDRQTTQIAKIIQNEGTHRPTS